MIHHRLRDRKHAREGGGEPTASYMICASSGSLFGHARFCTDSRLPYEAICIGIGTGLKFGAKLKKNNKFSLVLIIQSTYCKNIPTRFREWLAEILRHVAILGWAAEHFESDSRYLAGMFLHNSVNFIKLLCIQDSAPNHHSTIFYDTNKEKTSISSANSSSSPPAI